MRRLGIIAAFPAELRPLVRGWKQVRVRNSVPRARAWQGLLGPAECVAVAGGMGSSAAAAACSFAESLSDLDELISFGWAGALSCGMQGGCAYRVTEVIDGTNGERFMATPLASSGAALRLVTTDRVVLAQEKRALADRYQAVLVDMEAAAVARIAQSKGIPFACIKAVSDTPADLLPDFSRFTDAEGGLRMPALLLHLAFRPRYWRSLARMSKNSKTGAEAMVHEMQVLVERDANHSGC